MTAVGDLARILAEPLRPAPRFLAGDQVCEADRHEVWTVQSVRWTGTGWRIEASWGGCKASGPERGYRPATDADRAYRAPPMSERARAEAMFDSEMPGVTR